MTTFTLESHVSYLRELREADPLRFTTQLLGFDEKRIHYVHCMHHGEQGFLAATNELMSLHVSSVTRRAAAMQVSVQQRLAELLEAHSQLTPPPETGRRMGLDQRPGRS